MKNFNLTIYNEFTNELVNTWKNFEKESDNYYFQNLDWQKFWFQQMIKYEKQKFSVHIIVVKNDNDILFILPMCVNKFLNVKILTWSGFPFSDYNSPLIKKDLNINEDDFYQIWKLILSNKELFNCVNLTNQPEFINNTHNPFFKYLNTVTTTNYFGISLNKIDHINDLVKKSVKSDLRYQKNRLNKIGNLSFNLAKKQSDIKKIVRFILMNKSMQYQRTDGWNLFDINVYKKIFIKFNLKLKSNLYLSYLSLNDTIIAAHSGYIYNNRCYYLFPTYDTNFKKFSPGKILLSELVYDCKNNNLNYFDLTIGSEGYKKKWSNSIMKSCSTLKSTKFNGFVYILFIKVKMYIKFKNLSNNYLTKIFRKLKKNVT